MLIRPPPTPPYWPLYPEPERSRLEAAYKREHAEYCDELDRDLKIELSAFAVGILLFIPAIWFLT